MKFYAKSPFAYRLFQKILVLPAPRLLRSERNKSGYLQIEMPKEVSRIDSAIAASGDQQCDTMVILAFDEMTVKGKYYN